MKQFSKIWGKTVLPGVHIYENMSALCVVHMGLASIQTFLGGWIFFFFFKDRAQQFNFWQKPWVWNGLYRVLRSSWLAAVGLCNLTEMGQRRWKSYLWAGSPVAEWIRTWLKHSDLKLVIFLPLEWLGLQATILLQGEVFVVSCFNFPTRSWHMVELTLCPELPLFEALLPPKSLYCTV